MPSENHRNAESIPPAPLPENPAAGAESAPTTGEQPFRIVGIGASAGGLEALEQFFQHLPPDSGLAFVIVQHLDPSRQSSMPEILTRFTKLPVKVAVEGLRVEPNAIYLNPPDKNLGIRQGLLHLEDIAESRGFRLPIDFFLRSLAKDKGPDAICVILSGTGANGTLGLKAIKAEAGTALVQDPESAKYDGMPRSAVNTGLVDFILPPEQMPQRLIDFVRHSFTNGTQISATAEETREPLQQIFSILQLRTGHDFSRYKQSTLRRRLQRRMSVNSLSDIAAYARLLRESEAEVKALLKDILISVTSFFRDPEAFDALKARLNAQIKKSASADLRVWVPGCATGEEAYSIAILIAECLAELDRHLPVQIYATDIDLAALTVARGAVYPATITADVTPERLKRFFIKEPKGYQIKKEVREMVVFAPQDFIKDPPFSKMDLICCRNLLIYLESDVQKKLAPVLHYSLRPGGLLFLGTSETVGGATDLFSVLDKKWRIYQRREVIVSPERLRLPVTFSRSLREPAVEQAALLTQARLPELAEKIFLDNYAPTFAVVDEKYRLVYVRGRTGKYLEIASGQPNLSILEMAREGLRTELSTALYQASEGEKTVVREKVSVRHNGGVQILDLTVAPLAGYGLAPGLQMVVFQEVADSAAETRVKPAARGRIRTVKLEEELKLTRENLQSMIEELEATNEELKSANEELQSNNEELQSTNEELDTSREELQSLNEELLTVNAELSAKTDSLSQANDDLKNYLNRTDIAIIFLDEELRIRSYTPATADVFNVRDIDIGRPLVEINSRLAYDKMVDDAREVLRTLQPRETEVQRKDGHWYNLRITPYLTVQNTLGGLVMSFLDINKQKQAAEGLRRLATVVEDSNDAITTQDLAGRILTWNRGAESMYGYTRSEAVGMNSLTLVPEEARSGAVKFFEDIKNGQDISSLEVRRRTQDGRVIDVWLTITKLVDDRGRTIGIATTERDITQRKKFEEDLKRSNSELETANQELESFSYTVSHDLRAPLRGMNGFGAALQEEYGDKLDDKGQEYIRNIRASSELMSKLITDLLNLSRIIRSEMDPQEVSLSEIAEEMAAELARSDPTHKAEFKITPGLVDFGDIGLLRIVLRNLMDNSFKFTRPTPDAVIEFGAKEENGRKVYFVRDNGVGFDMAYANKLFKPFQRLHPTSQFPGNGMGLASVQRIIQRHGGRIWAEGEVGKGATFYFTLGKRL